MQEVSATNAIFDQCITHYYDRTLGKVSNPYYVWYHNKKKDHKAETWDDSGTVFTAEADEYEGFTATLPEQLQSSFPLSNGESLFDSFDSESKEGDTSSPLINGDIIFLTTDAAIDTTEGLNPLTFLPITNDNDLEQIPITSVFDEEEEEDADRFSDSLFFSQTEETPGSTSLSFLSQDSYAYSEDATAAQLENSVDYSLGFADDANTIASSSLHSGLWDLSIMKRAWRGFSGWVLGG
jgi:hypothetical protein